MTQYPECVLKQFSKRKKKGEARLSKKLRIVIITACCTVFSAFFVSKIFITKFKKYFNQNKIDPYNFQCLKYPEEANFHPLLLFLLANVQEIANTCLSQLHHPSSCLKK